MQHQAIVRCVQRHTAFTDPAFRITHVKSCCSFGEWLCQPVRYCTRQEHVDRPWYKIINGNPYYYKQLSLPQDGITQAKEFLQERLLLFSKIVFDPITRNNMLTAVKKKYIAKRNSLTTAEVNRRFRGSFTSDNEKWSSHWLQGSAKVPVISHTTESEISIKY